MQASLVIALLLTSCHGAQSTREAVAILCGNESAPDDPQALHHWLATWITNTEVQHFLGAHADADPWDLVTEIQRFADHVGLSTCSPLAGLVGIRTANGADVPVLTDSTGTLEMARAPIIAITPTRISVEGRGRFAKVDELNANLRGMFPTSTALIVADRALTMRTLVPILDAIRGEGASNLDLLVTAPTASRIVELAFRPGNEMSQTVVELGSSTFVNGVQVAPGAVRETIERAASERVVVVAEPNVTVQRLAETYAAAGGRAYFGASTLPHVIRSAPSP